MRSRKLAWFLMLGLLIALAGCGSDGNGGGATVMPDPPPVDMDALNAAKAAAMTAYEEAKQAVADVEAHKSADMDSYNMAVAKRGEAMDANTKAQEAETVADAEKYRDMARTANADAMKYAGMVTTAAEEAANKAASAAAMALAAKIAPAIADPDGNGTLGENSADAANDDLNNPMRPGKATENTDDFVVAAGGIGTPPIIQIGAAGATGIDRLGMEDAAVANNIEFAGEEGTAVGSFARNVHTRSQTSGGVKTTDKVTVLDNIDAAKNLPYREFYDDGTDALRTTSAQLNTAPYDRDAVTQISASGVLTIDTDDIGGNHKLFSSTALPSAGDQTYTYVDDDPATPANEEKRGGRTFDGAFNGVPGEFECSAGDCTASTDSEGNLNALVGTWTFTPDSGSHIIENATHDNDYLAFGYWLQTTGEGDDAAYKVGTFASGSMPFGGTEIAAAVSALTGSATYTGSATGMFVMKTDIDGDNKGPVETGSGEFTADTTLTAKFGGSGISNRDKFTISGMVHDFTLMNSDDTMIDNDWSLNLQSAPFATRTYNSETGEVDAAPTTHVNTFRGSTSGMEKGTAGSWTGTFYGPSPDIDPDAGGNQYGARNYPGGVAGEFIGHFENGHAVGAFGATKK